MEIAKGWKELLLKEEDGGNMDYRRKDIIARLAQIDMVIGMNRIVGSSERNWNWYR